MITKKAQTVICRRMKKKAKESDDENGELKYSKENSNKRNSEINKRYRSIEKQEKIDEYRDLIENNIVENSQTKRHKNGKSKKDKRAKNRRKIDSVDCLEEKQEKEIKEDKKEKNLNNQNKIEENPEVLGNEISYYKKKTEEENKRKIDKNGKIMDPINEKERPLHKEKGEEKGKRIKREGEEDRKLKRQEEIKEEEKWGRIKREGEEDRKLKRQEEKEGRIKRQEEEKYKFEIDNGKKMIEKIGKEKDICKRNKIDYYYNLKQGLINLGQTCYMNSFLQIIIHVPGFINSLSDFNGMFQKTSLTALLINIADNPSYYNLANFKNAIGSINAKYFYSRQKDSQEFGNELLVNLVNESINVGLIVRDFRLDNFRPYSENKKRMTIKNRYLEQLLNGEDCEYECEFKFETIISQTFQYFESETFSRGYNDILHVAYYGSFINQLSLYNGSEYYINVHLEELLKRKYSKNNKLIKLPKIFIITLCRAVMGKPLIKTNVKYPDTLDLRKFLDEDFGYYNGCTKYLLYALNICSGYSKEYGHYYSYIKINSCWFCFDDNDVEKVSIDDSSTDVYGLFYIRQDV